MIVFNGNPIVLGNFDIPYDCCYCCGARIFFIKSGNVHKFGKLTDYKNRGITIAVSETKIPSMYGTFDDEITSLNFGDFHVHVALTLNENALSEEEYYE